MRRGSTWAGTASTSVASQQTKTRTALRFFSKELSTSGELSAT